jgi:protein-tyrosine phosphatase
MIGAGPTPHRKDQIVIPTHADVLSGTWNFRDIGGTPTPDGPVRHGLVYRCAVLSGLDPAGQEALVKLGVTDVFDLRGELEIEREGRDRVPASISVSVTPFHPEDGTMPVHAAAADHADAATPLERSRRYYAAIPVFGPAQRSVATILRAVADTDGSVLVHCAAGKDRTGWTIATLLSILGADRDTIMAEYLLSNAAIGSLRDWLRVKYGDDFDSDDALLGVDPSFLHAGWSSVERNFGSFDGYLAAIGVGPDVQEAIRTRLLDR